MHRKRFSDNELQFQRVKRNTQSAHKLYSNKNLMVRPFCKSAPDVFNESPIETLLQRNRNYLRTGSQTTPKLESKLREKTKRALFADKPTPENLKKTTNIPNDIAFETPKRITPKNKYVISKSVTPPLTRYRREKLTLTVTKSKRKINNFRSSTIHAHNLCVTTPPLQSLDNQLDLIDCDSLILKLTPSRKITSTEMENKHKTHFRRATSLPHSVKTMKLNYSPKCQNSSIVKKDVGEKSDSLVANGTNLLFSSASAKALNTRKSGSPCTKNDQDKIELKVNSAFLDPVISPEKNKLQISGPTTRRSASNNLKIKDNQPIFAKDKSKVIFATPEQEAKLTTQSQIKGNKSSTPNQSLSTTLHSKIKIILSDLDESTPIKILSVRKTYTSLKKSESHSPNKTEECTQSSIQTSNQTTSETPKKYVQGNPFILLSKDAEAKTTEPIPATIGSICKESPPILNQVSDDISIVSFRRTTKRIIKIKSPGYTPPTTATKAKNKTVMTNKSALEIGLHEDIIKTNECCLSSKEKDLHLEKIYYPESPVNIPVDEASDPIPDSLFDLKISNKIILSPVKNTSVVEKINVGSSSKTMPKKNMLNVNAKKIINGDMLGTSSPNKTLVENPLDVNNVLGSEAIQIDDVKTMHNVVADSPKFISSVRKTSRIIKVKSPFTNSLLNLKPSSPRNMIKNANNLLTPPKCSPEKSPSVTDSLIMAIQENVDNLEAVRNNLAPTISSPSEAKQQSSEVISTENASLTCSNSSSHIDEAIVTSPLRKQMLTYMSPEKFSLLLKSPLTRVKISPQKLSPVKNSLQKLSPEKRSPQKSPSQKSPQKRVRKFKSGSIFWGRVGSYPYWPCIICPDIQGVTCSNRGRNGQKLHIKFFADSGRHAWISSSALMDYKGLLDFMEQSTSFTISKKAGSGKRSNYNPFVVKASSLEMWSKAIEEAEIISVHAIGSRIEMFEEMVNQSIRQKRVVQRERLQARRLSSVSTKSSINSKKRRRSRSPTPESPPFEPLSPYRKKVKLENVNQSAIDVIVAASLQVPIKTDAEEHQGEIENLISSQSLNQFIMKNFLSSQTQESTEGFDSFFENFKTNSQPLAHADNNQTNGSNIVDMQKLQLFAKKFFNLVNLTSNLISSDYEIKKEAIAKSSSSISSNDETVSLVSLNEESSTISTPSSSSVTFNDPTNMAAFTKTYLFKDLPRDFVCRICHKTNNVLKCEGICCGWYHRTCCQKNNNVGESGGCNTNESTPIRTKLDGSFMCDDCYTETKPACFVCAKYDDQPELRLRCKITACGRYYHQSCLKYFPQAKITSEQTLICPMHSCHTCISDDPRGKYMIADKTTFIKCVQCPSTYHMDSTCVPAGTEFISATQVICPKHRPRSMTTRLNANWCFICTRGGSLVCCETCPTAFHEDCLKISIPEDRPYICEECETGRLPLYGEIVWAKFANYRWWPSQIIPPSAVPDNVERLPQQEFDFCVKFFGANNYAWLNRDCVYLYQEGDWDVSVHKNRLDASYQKSLLEAKQMYERLQLSRWQKNSEQSDKLQPIPYVTIKANRPIAPLKLTPDNEEDYNQCSCSADLPNPCGPDSKCLNRMLFFECDPKICHARDSCQNQMFEKRMYPNVRVVKTSTRGWGLFSQEEIPTGTFVVEYVGEVIDDDEFRRRVYRKQKEHDENYYFLNVAKDYTIDAGPKGNVARFMNHSCEPNCETQKWIVNGIKRVGLFALEDIPVNTELTFNYNLDCLGDNKKICQCGAEKCAGFIGAKYKEDKTLKKIENSKNETVSKKKRAKSSVTKKKRKSLPVADSVENETVAAGILQN